MRFSSLSLLAVAAGCQGLTPFDLYTSATPEDQGLTDDTGAEVIAPAVAVDTVSPNYGTTDGGIEVVISGGPFDSTSRVFFGTAEAQIVDIEPNELRVEVPPGPVGPASVRITSSAGAGELADGFTYFEDASGQVGVLGSMQWFNSVGGYWGSEPDDFGFASAFFITPSDVRHREVYLSNSLDSCASNYEFTGELEALEVGVDELVLTSASHNVALPADPDTTWYYTADLSSSDWAATTSFALEGLVDVPGWPDMHIDDALVTPGTITVSTPAIYGSAAPDIPRTLPITWSTATPGDYVAIYLDRYDSAGNLVESVSCAARDDGAFTVPSNAWTSWATNQQINIYIGRASESEGRMPHNNAQSGIVGISWVLGAGFSI